MRWLAMPLLLLVAAYAADRDLAGHFAGDWSSSSSGVGGGFQLSLDPSADGAWKCEVTFALMGEQVKTTMRQVKVEGSKLDVTYDFTFQGAGLRSHITGTWNGKGFDGTYQTTAVEGGAQVDDGKWSAARK